MGRPSRYTNKLGDAICKRIADGESLRSICSDPEMPHRETVRAWLASDAAMYRGFSVQYARAREEQADHYAEQIIEIADTATDVQKARLQVDARKWYASKLRPKKYGTDRIQHSGDPDEPVTVMFKKVTAD